MRTLRLSLVGAVIVALLGGLGGAAVAQEVVTVTGQSHCEWADEHVEPADGEFHGLESYEGHRMVCLNEMSDPRVSGVDTGWWSEQCPVDGDPCILWGAGVLEGPDGEWECNHIHMEPGPAFERDFAIAVCAGTDDYDGFTYIWQAVQSDVGMTSDHWGYIYEGPPPVEVVPVLLPPPVE